jgi:Lipocalin-like domain
MPLVTASRHPPRDPLAPHQPALRAITARFCGTWRLMSWTIEQADGARVAHPMGPDPLGQIMYRPDGQMSVALMRSDCQKFASDNLTAATPDEAKTALEGYLGYCGAYEIDAQARVVVHRIALSSFPNLVGTEQRRYFAFAGDQLTLWTAPLTVLGEARVHRLTWGRLG